MKTAKEITIAIETREEEKRANLVKWAIDLMDDASEKMFENLISYFRIETGNAYDFNKALAQDETKTWLETNGFKVEEQFLGVYILKIA